MDFANHNKIAVQQFFDNYAFFELTPKRAKEYFLWFKDEIPNRTTMLWEYMKQERPEEIYARAISPASTSIFLFQKNLDYIDDLLILLRNKPNHWENKISERIAKTEYETTSLWLES